MVSAPFSRRDPEKPGPHRPDDAPPQAGSTPLREPYEPLLENIAQWSALASHYASAQGDLVRLKIRRAMLYVVAWIFGRVVLTVALAYAVWMVLRGSSGGLAEVLGGRAWAGDLVTGILFLATIGGVFYYGSRRVAGLSRQKVKDLYEQRRHARQPASSSRRGNGV